MEIISMEEYYVEIGFLIQLLRLSSNNPEKKLLIERLDEAYKNRLSK